MTRAARPAANPSRSAHLGEIDGPALLKEQVP